MSRKDLSVKKYGISKEKYRELMYFCMQYQDMKDTVQYGLNSHDNDGQPKGNSVGHPTENQALNNEKYSHEIRIIEESAKEVSASLAEYILKSVTEGISYEYMYVPVGRRHFYELRKKFFYILSKKR